MKLFIGIIKAIHFRIFGYEITPKMKVFFRSLSWSFLGTVTSAIVLFVLNILAGRILGPIEYGKYNLVLVVSGVVVIPIVFGFDSAIVKYISSERNEDKIKSYFTNSIIVISCGSLLSMIVAYLCKNYLSVFLKTDSLLVLVGFIFAIISAYKLILDSMAKGLREFRKQAIIKLIESGGILLSFILFIFVLKKVSYAYYIISVSFGAVLLIISYFLQFRKEISRWDKKSFLEMAPYSLLNLSTSIIAIVLASLDKIFINRYMGFLNLGLYSAYLMSTTVVASQLILSINNVFFPEVNNILNKKDLMGKVERLSFYAFIPFILVMSLVSYLIILMFGSNYPIIPVWIFLSSVVAFFQLVSMFFSNIVMSSKEMFKVFARAIYCKPILIVGIFLLLYLIGRFNIAYILLVLIVSSLYDIVVSRILILSQAS